MAETNVSSVDQRSHVAQTLEVILMGRVCDDKACQEIPGVVLRAYVHSDQSWVIALHDGLDPLRNDQLSGEGEQACALFVDLWGRMATLGCGG